jgi:uncharacterized RDD family membrane protein YckC
MQPGQLALDGMLYVPAGLWPRVGAFLLDAIVLGIVHAGIVALAGITQPSYHDTARVLEQVLRELLRGMTLSAGTLQQLERLGRPAQLAGWLNVGLCAAYFTCFHGLVGASLGKLALGLRVLRGNGRPLGIGWALLRYACYFLLAKVAYSAWLVPFEPQRRTLYDLALGCNVYRRARLHW